MLQFFAEYGTYQKQSEIDTHNSTEFEKAAFRKARCCQCAGDFSPERADQTSPLNAEEKKIGGLSRAAEVLQELSETIAWDNDKLPLLTHYRSGTLQRLGYLLELIEAHQQADDLFALIKETGKTLRKTPLKQEVAVDEGMNVDKRWKIIENYKLEIDEI